MSLYMAVSNLCSQPHLAGQSLVVIVVHIFKLVILAFSHVQSKDGALVQNHAAEEELHDLENVRNHLVEETKELVENNKSIPLFQVSESDLVAEDAVPNVHSTLKLCSTLKSSVPRNKRKRRKKSGSKCWSRRSFG